ncbi:MAG TPA: radical SAM protein, partial [Proteobacteria bacterium]|nr:radical SAM protein [Pseudomonadota bacterium]
RELIEPLDNIPYPTYEEFDHDRYLGDALILEWSRGCIGNCTFCKGREISGHYRPRSAKHIFAELEHHIGDLDYRSFTICDPVLIGDPKIIDELCDYILDAGYEIRWNGEALPGKWISPELLHKMAKAGCCEIQWGVETGSNDVLKKMGKLRFFRVEDAERVIRWSHDAGIKTCLFVIVGFPGETKADFEKTLEFIRRNRPWIDQVKSINSLHIITDTMLHRHADKFGLKLPEKDYHYLWEGPHGNTPEERARRIRETLKLCQELGIEVLETNLAEGKHYDLAAAISKGGLSREEQVKVLAQQINRLESFDPTLDVVRTEREVIRIDGHTSAAAESERTDAAVESMEAEKPAYDEATSAASGLSDRDRVELAGILSDKVFVGPRILELDLTNNCNLNCVGCWCHSDLLRERKLTGEKKRLRLPFDLIERLLHETRAMGTEFLQLAGAGEPFMHPKIMEILELAKSLGFAVNVITNFTLIDEKRAERLVDLGVDVITISLWAGSTKTYLKTHPNQRAGTFKRIREMLTYIHDLKQKRRAYKPHIKIYNVISTLNANDITNMVDFALDVMADYIEIT